MYVSFCFTVTVQPAVFPLLLVAVITAVPAFFAVTFPLLSTAATASLLLLHFTVLSPVAFDGAIVDVNISLSPSVKLVVLLLRPIPVMAISFCFTVTVQLALFPLLLVAVITAVPAFFAVTFPLLSTAATSALLLLHFTVLSPVAFDGVIVAVNVSLSPSVKLVVLLLRLIPVMAISFCFTVTVQPAVFPLLLVAVITAVPAFFAVTFPLLSTAATASLLLLHFTVLSPVAFDGVIVAVNVSLSPSVNVVALLLRLTFSTSTVVVSLSVNALIIKLPPYDLLLKSFQPL